MRSFAIDEATLGRAYIIEVVIEQSIKSLTGQVEPRSLTCFVGVLNNRVASVAFVISLPSLLIDYTLGY